MRADDDFLPSDAMVNTYIAWFAARTDLFVKNASGVVREPLTPQVVRDAVTHHYPISAYLATDEGETHVGAIDFDTETGLADARRVTLALHDADVFPLLCHSRRGAHLWVTCWEVVTAQQMRRALEAGLWLASVEQTPKIEVFPKEGTGLAAGALRMPGMPHQTTHQTYDIEVYDVTGWSVLMENLLDILEAHMPTTKDSLLALSKKVPKKKREYPKGLGRFYGHKPEKDWGEDPKASEVLAHWGVTAKAGQTVRCPKHDDHRRSLTVFKDDKRVYCGSPLCVLHNNGHGVGSVALSKMEA